MVPSFTTDELLCTCIARQVQDGDILAQGINTPLVMAGYILAKLTHAPGVYFTSAIGQSMCQEWAALGVGRAEDQWLGKAQIHWGFVKGAADLLPSYRPKEFFRPAQVDSAGNFNNIAFGTDYTRPRMRLPGTGGIPDVTAYLDAVYLYVPRHSRVTFVETLDFISGLGNRAAGEGKRRGVVYLVSDLGQFDWAAGHMRLTHLHPGVTLEQVQKKTGFSLATAPDLSETPPPTAEELRLLRDVIDPLGVRQLETLGGAARKLRLQEILTREGAW
jgi:acyl CoA:acetate/3-ketoacid CoA transferase beta subunit